MKTSAASPEDSGQRGIGPGADGAYQPCPAECRMTCLLLSRPDKTISATDGCRAWAAL